MKCLNFTAAVIAALVVGAISSPAFPQVSATGGNAAGLANAGPQAQSAAGATANSASNSAAQAGANAAAGATATNRVDVEQTQIGVQSQHQGQIQGNIGLGSGNKTSIDIAAPVIPTKTKVADTPDVTGTVFTANACALGATVGGSGPGVGGLLGLTWESADCRKQQVAAQFYAKGAAGAADGDAVLCTVPAAAVAPTCKKLAEAQKRAEAEETQRLAAQQPRGGPDLSDPYIRARLGK